MAAHDGDTLRHAIRSLRDHQCTGIAEFLRPGNARSAHADDVGHGAARKRTEYVRLTVRRAPAQFEAITVTLVVEDFLAVERPRAGPVGKRGRPDHVPRDFPRAPIAEPTDHEASSVGR